MVKILGSYHILALCVPFKEDETSAESESSMTLKDYSMSSNESLTSPKMYQVNSNSTVVLD